MTKSRSASNLARKRWAKTTSPAARRAATAPATAARWPRCVHCGLTESQGRHDTDGIGLVASLASHYFEPKGGDK